MKPESHQTAMRAIRMVGMAEILRSRALEARKIADSLDRMAAKIEAEFPEALE